MKEKIFDVVIEQDKDGFYIATVPALHGCHTQAESLDELFTRVREVILLCLEVQAEKGGGMPTSSVFVGIHRVPVSV